MPRIKTFYDELGVGPKASPAAIKQAFKEVAKVYHPDKNTPDRQEWAHEQMSRLNFIVETLLSSKTRAEYDALVRQYEQAAATAVQNPQRRRRQEYALRREYACVSVELMNLGGKCANYRLKITFGGFVVGLAILVLLTASFTAVGPYISTFHETFAHFLILMGSTMVIIGFSDYLGRGHYRRRIRELEHRRSVLRSRIYEADLVPWASVGS